MFVCATIVEIVWSGREVVDDLRVRLAVISGPRNVAWRTIDTILRLVLKCKCICIAWTGVHVGAGSTGELCLAGRALQWLSLLPAFESHIYHNRCDECDVSTCADPGTNANAPGRRRFGLSCAGVRAILGHC